MRRERRIIRESRGGNAKTVTVKMKSKSMAQHMAADEEDREKGGRWTGRKGEMDREKRDEDREKGDEDGERRIRTGRRRKRE